MQGRNGWDCYHKFAPHGSDEWASSDRGWLRIPEVEDSSVANYLDYGPDHYSSNPRAGNIHACFYGPNAPRQSKYFDTVQNAKIWCESLTRAQNGQLSLWDEGE